MLDPYSREASVGKMFPRLQDFWANSCFRASMTLLRSLVLLYVCKTKQYYIISIVLSLIGSAMYWFFTCFSDLGVYISGYPCLSTFIHLQKKTLYHTLEERGTEGKSVEAICICTWIATRNAHHPNAIHRLYVV